jgi:hypothetical protein
MDAAASEGDCGTLPTALRMVNIMFGMFKRNGSRKMEASKQLNVSFTPTFEDHKSLYWFIAINGDDRDHKRSSPRLR